MSSVLIVDDSSFQRQILKTALKMGGFDIFEASSGEECLQLLQNTKPDCIWIDLLMPKMSGLELLDKLHQNYSGIPVIVGTADIQSSTKEKCISLGARLILNKPFKKKDMLEAVNSVLS
jgi:CheY-like chemotaxis protein